MKKAQLQGMETIMISIILIIIIIIGVYAFIGTSHIDAKKEINNIKIEKIKLLSEKLSYMPELSCPDFGSSKTSPCVDEIKMKIFSNMIKEKPELKADYYGLFGSSEISIKKVYPPSDSSPPPTQMIIYNGTKDDKGFSRWYPITIYNGTTQKRSLGLLIIRSE